MSTSQVSVVEKRVAAARRARIDIWPGAFFAAVIAASIVILALLAIVIALSFRIGSLGAADARLCLLANYPAIFLDNFTYRVLGQHDRLRADHVRRRARLRRAGAWLAERTDLRGKGLLLHPDAFRLLMPGFGSAMGWLFLLHPRIGLLNSLATRPSAVPPRPSTSPPSPAWAGCRG